MISGFKIEFNAHYNSSRFLIRILPTLNISSPTGNSTVFDRAMGVEVLYITFGWLLWSIELKFLIKIKKGE